jgi:uncharacterized membrane protein
MARHGSRGRASTGPTNASIPQELRAITRVQASVWHRVRSDGLRLLFLGAMTVGAAFIIASSLAYFDFGELPPFAIEKLPVRFSTLWLASLRVHVAAALVSLPLCILLMTQMVQRRRAMHRWLGRAAGMIILFALAPSGAVLAFDAKGGAFVTAGFLLSDALVAFFMMKGIAAARRRDLVTHRRAMGHVFAQMSVAVTSRAMLMALDVAGVSPDLAYVVALWIPVVGSAAAAEMFCGVWSKVRFLGGMTHGLSKVVRSLRLRAPARPVVRVGR